jgi:hypothetical protein
LDAEGWKLLYTVSVGALITTDEMFSPSASALGDYSVYGIWSFRYLHSKQAEGLKSGERDGQDYPYPKRVEK